MTQLAYNLDMGVAHVGLLYDIRPHRIVSDCAEGIVPFGSAVIPGTDAEKQVKVPTATSQTFRGVALSTWAQEQNASGDGEYKDTTPVNVLKQGVVWVEVNGNVLVDQPAFFVYTGADVGKFRADGTDADAVPTGVFRSSANSGELAQLEINLP
jgi:hypothetical protein